MVQIKYIKHGVYNFQSFLLLVQKVVLSSPLICTGLTTYVWHVLWDLFGTLGEAIQ